jgi:hypothetical protein
MTLVTLVHPEETFTVSTLQAMAKCRLFAKNPTLTTSSYRVESRVSLSIFRDFVNELEDKSITIDATNLIELDRLCEEFDFNEFSAKLSNFFEIWKCSEGRQFGSVFAGVRNVSLNESIEFHVNGIVIEIEISEAAALFPSVREQLSVDGCGRKFYVNLRGIEALGIRSLELVLSGESISIVGSEALLSSFFGNADLEGLFFGCCQSETRMNLSELKKERLLDFESVDISVFSIEALDSLLLNEIVTVESEDSLLFHILKLGSVYRDLVRHIQLEFLSEDGLSVLCEELGIPPELV